MLTLLAIIAALLFATQASATVDVATYATYTCAGFKTIPAEVTDRDPVVSAEIDTAKEGHQLHINVRHTTLTTELYSRGEQYRDIRFWSDRRGDYWSGVSVKNPRRTMVGQLGYDDIRGAATRRYIEKLFVGRRLERTTTSTCVMSDD
jgi:hypothetical protein